MARELLIAEPTPLPALSQLARLRQRPVLFWSGAVSGEMITPWYAWLRARRRLPALDVVLESGGGDPHVARRLAVAVREHSEQLAILVPDVSSSASTLLCLAADELVMTPLSMLGPIDPQVPGRLPADQEQRAEQKPSAATPRSIATEEVRLFGEMALAWFGVGESTEEKEGLWQAFASRIFPTSLTAFFRADQEMRAAAAELLSYHQPEADVRQQISERLIAGFFSHAHAIHRAEAARLGLPVRAATVEEEDCLWRLLTWSRARLRTPWNAQEGEQPSLIQALFVTEESALLQLVPTDVLAQRREEREAAWKHLAKMGWREVSHEQLRLSPEDL
jgi:hypothetical protein